MDKWFGAEEDISPGSMAWYPVRWIHSAMSDAEGITVFLEDGLVSMRCECGRPLELVERLVGGSLNVVLKKGIGGVTSVSFKRKEV
jgi:hypothetical protein